MKCIILLTITIACVLSGASASNKHKVEKAHSDVISYVAENMGGVRMMRSNRDHLDCYNGFLPMINSLAAKAKEQSNACVINASEEKDTALSKMDREEIAAKIKQITDSLEDCTSKNGMEYFVCLANNADTNRQLLEAINNLAKQAVSDSTSVVANIVANEDNCIMDAVDKAKAKSDAAFSQLKSCLRGEATFENTTDQ